MGELCDAICSGNRSAAAAAWGINRAVFEPSRPIGRRVVMKVLEATGHLGVMKAGVQSGEPLRNVGKTSPIARKFTQLAVEASTPEWRQAFATASGLAESGIRPESYGRDKVGTPASGGAIFDDRLSGYLVVAEGCQTTTPRLPIAKAVAKGLQMWGEDPAFGFARPDRRLRARLDKVEGAKGNVKADPSAALQSGQSTPDTDFGGLLLSQLE